MHYATKILMMTASWWAKSVSVVNFFKGPEFFSVMRWMMKILKLTNM